MRIGMIGLGRMGANMVRRLQQGGHQCVAYDRGPDSVKAVAAFGARGVGSPAELVAAKGELFNGISSGVPPFSFL